MTGQLRTGLATAAATAAIGLLGACGAGPTSHSAHGSGGAPRAETGPLKIGISLSLSGDFTDPGNAAKRGYELWADNVNSRGGVLGRQVALDILNDASTPERAAANYDKLIRRDHVDLVFGPFSTLLTVPAAKIANRYHYAFPEPAGGGPAVFAERLSNVFFVQPSAVVNCGDPFVKWVLSLPASRRPRTAAYPTLDDPFAAPIADRARRQLEAAGIKTVFTETYPASASNLTPLVRRYAKRNPDLVFAGVQPADGLAQVKAMRRLKFNPKLLFLANSPADFPAQVGTNNSQGVFTCGDWFSHSQTAGNPEFIGAYIGRYGGTPQAIDPGSAEAYSVGQLIELVAQRTGRVDNQTIITSLHGGNWPVVEGNLSWNAVGAPTGSAALAEWTDGKLLPVYPNRLAVAKLFAPKPAWGASAASR